MSAVENIAVSLFRRALNAVNPNTLVAGKLKRCGNTLYLDGQQHNLNHNVHLVGFGKAISGMGHQVQSLVGEHLVDGAISIPHGILQDLAESNSNLLLPINDGKIKIYEGAKDNQPDETAHEAAKEILKICERATEHHLIIALISGGGSASLPLPVPPMTLHDKMFVTKSLASKGANIQELNTVRQNLSLVKGGRLAQAASPAKVWSLILSDIIDDPVEMIASGPTVQSTTSIADALCVLDRYNLTSSLPSSVYLALEKAKTHSVMTNLDHVHNVLVGNNKVAIEAVKLDAERRGFIALVLGYRLQGEAKKLGEIFAQLSACLVDSWHTNTPMHSNEEHMQFVSTQLQHHGLPAENLKLFTQKLTKYQKDPQNAVNGICVIGGGETTVTLGEEYGLGGRNQEMVLSFARKMLLDPHPMNFDVTFLSAGTDGQDGPTPAAGAVISTSDLNCHNLSSIEDHLSNHDSYRYFKKIGSGLIHTGLTGTNVMDLQLLIITPKTAPQTT
ncbi:glycerate kinase-like [Clavelina lepadiformis]|uniref:glycerate kinase-like n=1 Tax=Clavelina lepadiformis TaxID=159417 RepID=UPI00404308A9